MPKCSQTILVATFYLSHQYKAYTSIQTSSLFQLSKNSQNICHHRFPKLFPPILFQSKSGLILIKNWDLQVGRVVERFAFALDYWLSQLRCWGGELSFGSQVLLVCLQFRAGKVHLVFLDISLLLFVWSCSSRRVGLSLLSSQELKVIHMSLHWTTKESLHWKAYFIQ